MDSRVGEGQYQDYFSIDLLVSIEWAFSSTYTREMWIICSSCKVPYAFVFSRFTVPLAVRSTSFKIPNEKQESFVTYSLLLEFLLFEG
jgi:hypothetical protein